MTQKEIAKILNITQATVSMALKASHRISPEVREAVRKLAVEAGYQPNLAGQMLRKKRSNVIGAIFPRLNNLFYAELFEALQQALVSHGFMLYLASAENREKLVETINTLRGMCVAGVIAFAPADQEALAELKNSGLATILYGGDHQFDVGLSQVLPDRYTALRELMQRLINQGRRHIAFFGAAASIQEMRVRAYTDALLNAGLTPEYISSAHAKKRSGAEDAYKLMRNYLNTNTKVDAIVAYNDELALVTKRAITDSGRKIPRDIALTGFDNIQAGAYLTPSLTTVEQPCAQIAKALINELLLRLNNPDHVNFISIPCSVIIRESI